MRVGGDAGEGEAARADPDVLEAMAKTAAEKVVAEAEIKPQVKIGI